MTETTIPYTASSDNPPKPPRSQAPPAWALIDLTIEPGFKACTAVWRHTNGSQVQALLVGEAANTIADAGRHPSHAVADTAAAAIQSLAHALTNTEPEEEKEPSMPQNGTTPALQAITDVLVQRATNERKWSTQDHLDQPTWLAILTEEIGEAARAILQANGPQLRAELVDLASATIAMIEHLDRTLGHSQLTPPSNDQPTTSPEPAHTKGRSPAARTAQ